MSGTRLALAAFCLALPLATGGYAGPRAGLLMLIGLGFGLTLEGLRFGFAGPWRAAAVDRDGRGLIAQLLAIGLAASAAMPLLAAAPGELSGAHAPVGLAMIGAAFAFGAAMQVVAGCGSGTLVNAGSGNLIGAVALATFIAGSTLGALHIAWWTGPASLPVITLQGLFGPSGGLVATLLGLAALAAVVAFRSAPGRRRPTRRLVVAAVLIAGLAVLNLVVAGQPWGVVYGLGLWGAKLSLAAGADVAATGFWSAPANAARLSQSVLLDVTSLTNFGLIAGAFVAMRWRPAVAPQVLALRPAGWLAVLAAGFVLGYSSRIAFGCNVGAFFSGISTGSLHGWAWFAAAWLGSSFGHRLRPRLLAATPLSAGAA